MVLASIEPQAPTTPDLQGLLEPLGLLRCEQSWQETRGPPIDYGDPDGGQEVSKAMAVPNPAELGALPVEVTRAEDPWVVSVRMTAGDDSVVRLTWDEVACSATVWWYSSDRQLVRMERETVSRISVRSLDGYIEFEIASISEGLAGTMVVRIHEGVTISDALLRT